MKDFNLFNVQISDLELFLNVAKYGSFTKAGEKLFMSQSWVSKRISQMETELGLVLFLRNKREVTLTPAGKVLNSRLQSVTATILDAIQAAHAVQSGASGFLRIGYLEWGTIVFLDRLEQFMQDNPQLSVEVYREQFSELRSDLSSGRMDLIFTTSYDSDQLSGGDFVMARVKKIPLMAYMHRSHRLAGRSEISIDELRAEPILMVDQKSSSGYSSYIRGLFAQKSIIPNIAQYASSGGAHIGSILLNRGVLLASQYFLENSWEDMIARVPILGAELYVVAIWRKENQNPMLIKFIDSVTPDEI